MFVVRNYSYVVIDGHLPDHVVHSKTSVYHIIVQSLVVGLNPMFLDSSQLGFTSVESKAFAGE